MPALLPQQILGADLSCAAKIVKVAIIPASDQVPADGDVTPDGATEGPASRVRYDANVTQPPTAFQSCPPGLIGAMPAGRPTDDAVVTYAKIGDPCIIYVPRSGDAVLIVLTEKIRFGDCATQQAFVPGKFVAGGA